MPTQAAFAVGASPFSTGATRTGRGRVDWGMGKRQATKKPGFPGFLGADGALERTARIEPRNARNLGLRMVSVKGFVAQSCSSDLILPLRPSQRSGRLPKTLWTASP